VIHQTCLIVALLTASATVAAQAPAPTEGAAFLRLVWSRVADLNGELGSVECAEFSADGRFIATATKYSNEIAVWRVADGTVVWSAKADQEVERVAFSPDGKMLAAGGEDDQLRLFSAADGKLLGTRPHTAAIDSLRWSPDGLLLATGEESGKVRLWRMPEGKQVGVGEVGDVANELDFTSDGKLLVAVGNKTGLRVFDTANMSVVKVIHRKQKAPIISVRFSPDNRLVAAGGYGGDIEVWRVADGEPVKQLNFTGRKVETVEFSPDSQYLLYAGHDPHIRLIRVSDWAMVHQSTAVDNAEYIAFSRNGSFLTSAHQDGMVRLWVWMRGDAGLNDRLHQELKKKQAAEDTRKSSSR
jgi:WD40 repeat protein